MPRLAPALLLAFTAASAAAAEGFADYDIEASCRADTEATGFEPDVLMFTNCVEMAQESRDLLAPRWDSFPEEARGSCEELAQLGGNPSYYTMLICFVGEGLVDAAESPLFG